MKNALFKNTSIVFGANSICVIVNVIVNFLIPICFSEDAYAYYQLENLYCGYLWILTLGWQEGVYLHYGGMSEKDIRKNEIRTQFWMLLVYLCIMCAGTLFISNAALNDFNRRYVLCMAMLSITIEGVRYVFLYYLICINKMIAYSKYIIADRIVYICLIVTLIAEKQTGYRMLLGADILSKLIITVFVVLFNKELFFGALLPIKNAINETKTMIKSGINVTSASFVSRFVTGTVRMAIDYYWGIAVFGKISFTLSISNMFSQFVQAISVVLFPTIRKSTEEGQKMAYRVLSELLDAFMFFAFILYLPGITILNVVLPAYREGLRYMAILFPVCLFDARNTILNTTYLKAVHKERGILFSNIVAVVCSILLTFISIFVFQSLEMAAVVIVLLVAIKCFTAEFFLHNTLRISMWKQEVSEIAVVACFIASSWYVTGMRGMMIYCLILGCYYAVHFRRIKSSVSWLVKR